jgi:hypothetical protein
MVLDPVSLETKELAGNGNIRYQICDATVPFKLVSGKLSGFCPGRGILNTPRGADYSPIQ